MSLCLEAAAPDARAIPRSLHIAVVGASLNGLVWAGLFARWGHRVTLIEESPEVRAAYHTGALYADEPGLWHVLELARHEGSLALARAAGPVVAAADVVMLADDPPMDDAGIAWDRLESQAVTLAADMAPGAAMLIVASAHEGASGCLAARLSGAWAPRLGVCLEPLERGEALFEALCGDRLLLGASGAVPSALRSLFEPLDRPVVWTSALSAERLVGATAAWQRVERAFWSDITGLSQQAEDELALWARPMDRAV